MFIARHVWLSALAAVAFIAASPMALQVASAQEAQPKPKPAAADPFGPNPAAQPPASERFEGNLSLVIGGGQTVHVQKSKIEKALGEGAVLDFVEMPLQDVVQYLQDAHKIPIVLNRQKLEMEASISADTPLTFNMKGVSLAAALDLLLRPLGLTYDVTEVLEITTPKDLQSRPHLRLYDCRDLLALRPDGTLPTNPEGFQPLQQLAPGDGESMIQTITRTVDAASWNTQSGNGTIENFKGMLIVSHSWRTHQQIEKLLNTIRETAGLEPRAGKPVQ